MTGRSRRAAIAPAPIPADVGIVAAMSIEVGFLLDRLGKVRKYVGPRYTIHEGVHEGKIVVLVIGGMGRTRAREATKVLIDGHRPRWIISAGFAGGLDPALKRSDVLMPNEIVDMDDGRFQIDVSVPETAGSSLSTGRLLTVDTIARTAAEKAALREQFGADAVDMESSAVAAVCSERGVRLLSIRVVSDEAGIDLPKEVASLMTRSGSYQVGAALRAIWNRPSSVKDFWALHEHAQEAADRLADVTLGAIERLPA
jgi:adenosylhomocysteine nucleosidase